MLLYSSRTQEKLGIMMAKLEAVEKKLDLSLDLQKEQRQDSVRKEEFNLFKKICYSFAGVLISAGSALFYTVFKIKGL